MELGYLIFSLLPIIYNIGLKIARRPSLKSKIDMQFFMYIRQTFLFDRKRYTGQIFPDDNFIFM